MTTLVGLSKDDFRDIRNKSFYDLPNASTYGDFWRHEQELVMKQFYAKLSKWPVRPQSLLDFGYLESKQYLVVWVSRKFGLEKLMRTQQHYKIGLVQQFFASLVIGSGENLPMTWMTGPKCCYSDFVKFASLLGYKYNGSTHVGKRMHVVGVEYNRHGCLFWRGRGGF